MLHVGTFWWGDKYPQSYVDKLASGLRRHLKQPFKWHIFRPEPEDEHLTQIPGCLCRLRAFDPAWQQRQGIAPGDRVVSIDLDVVITGPLDPLFDRGEDFVIVEGANSSNPDPTNGSLWMFRAGTHRDVWEDFSLAAVGALKYHEFPDDQGWFFHKIPDFAGWHVGPEHGLYCFMKPGWPKGEGLPPGARIVCFPGFRDPAQFTHIPWIKKHWLVHPVA